MTVMVEMFRKMVLDANLKNTKTMVCTPESTWREWDETEYK